ncbi:lipoyl(octanoyl) transferase LipB [Crassaminicella profunda]|uniref:lipoyl(octanoyl) transferase LipB n=1 Tax=Crassaminicella profunda TaxID=1286698 RepID=UPI001CA6E447|nr:lipoyl(octanoyl) transferase LipB [Crassaminicella profunda]QZY53600.1 lipoyl(octanoyl) transferase LipB [Crassaminicella profunda]
MKINVLFLGRCEYKKALKIQYDLLKKRQDQEIEDTLILVEHPSVITLGRRAEKEHILGSEKFLNDQGIHLVKINRGGDVTYHGEGQIVGYPIVDLKNSHMGIRTFVRNLEDVFIKLLKEEYKIIAGRDAKYTGVWVNNKKIVAIGLAVKRGIIMHGFAFNVNTNLNYFRWIVPCGISDRGVTSVQNIIGRAVDFNHANQLVLDYFCKTFNYKNYEERYLNK